MESGSYQELKEKNQNSRFVAILIASVTVMLCLLVGVGTWILVSDSTQSAIPVNAGKNVVEEIVIVEEVKPPVKLVQEPIVNVKENPVESVIYEEVQEAIKQEEREAEANPSFNPEEMPFLHTLVKFSNDIAGQILGKLSQNERFAALFNQPQETHSRHRRALSTIGAATLKYISYATFGNFLFREVKDITEFAEEGRKLSGDADSMFLDNDFWSTYEISKPAKEIVEKIDTDVNAVETASNIKKVKQSNKIPSAYDNGWTPMVNKVSLKFITNMLRTLLNLMREYLTKDHVMECLWFMFCKDMNHQAKYTDPMGYFARINSVGLQVLVDKEGREADTVSSVWRALTQWEPLQCEAMFPKCDGSRALEIVNEVANAARR